jgi:hypothetical protein
MRRTHTFVVKILLVADASSFDDRPAESGQAARPTVLGGQITEPSSADLWRAMFVDMNELIQCLLERLASAPSESPGGLALD